MQNNILKVESYWVVLAGCLLIFISMAVGFAIGFSAKSSKLDDAYNNMVAAQNLKNKAQKMADSAS